MGRQETEWEQSNCRPAAHASNAPGTSASRVPDTAVVQSERHIDDFSRATDATANTQPRRTSPVRKRAWHLTMEFEKIDSEFNMYLKHDADVAKLDTWMHTS